MGLTPADDLAGVAGAARQVGPLGYWAPPAPLGVAPGTLVAGAEDSGGALVAGADVVRVGGAFVVAVGVGLAARLDRLGVGVAEVVAGDAAGREDPLLCRGEAVPDCGPDGVVDVATAGVLRVGVSVPPVPSEAMNTAPVTRPARPAAASEPTTTRFDRRSNGGNTGARTPPQSAVGVPCLPDPLRLNRCRGVRRNTGIVRRACWP